MPTITATVLPALAGVRLDVDFTDTDSPYAYITRTNQMTGVTSPVRLHGQSTTIGTLAYANLYAGFRGVFYDVEAPLDTPISYSAASVFTVQNINTGFESGTLLPWIPGSATTLFTLGTGTSLAGSFFGQLNGDGTTATPAAFAERIPATPGASWTVTANAASNAVAVTLGIRWLNSAGGLISAPGTSTTPGTTSTPITFTGAAPALTAYAQPYYQLNGTPSNTAVTIFDDVVASTAAASATSATVTVQSLSQAYLKDPQNPANNVIVTFCFDPQPGCTPQEGIFFQSMDPAEQWASNSAAFNINNQPDAAIVAKQRQNPAGTLVLVTRQFADRDRLLALLNPGTPLLWQVPSEYGIPDRYLGVGAVSVNRPLPDHRYSVRGVSLPFVSAVAPGGLMGGVLGARWQDACNRFATWGAINSAGITWQQALQGALG